MIHERSPKLLSRRTARRTALNTRCGWWRRQWTHSAFSTVARSAVALGIALGGALGGLTPGVAGAAEGEGETPRVVHAFDFTQQPEGEAVDWLRKEGFELELDARALDPRFGEKGLLLSTDRSEAGLFARKLSIPAAERIRVVWGVDRYPSGANWEKGVFRVPIAVMVSFGEEEIDSGSFFVPDAPYFISLFLSRNARAGKSYTANYYRKGGRYFCVECSPPPGKTISTEFDLATAFRKEFDLAKVPPITSFSFQMNTKDTRGGARAWLSRVEFLAN